METRGLRLTPRRKAILEAVRESGQHPTAAEIYNRVRAKHPAIAYATVYNALNALARHGQVLAISLGREAGRFDGRTDRHDHAVCTQCGKVTDVEFSLSREAIQAVAQATGITIRAYHTEFEGLCSQCRREYPSSWDEKAGP